MTQSQIAPIDLLKERIQDDIDSSIVVTDASEVPLYSSDVYADGTPLRCRTSDRGNRGRN